MHEFKFEPNNEQIHPKTNPVVVRQMEFVAMSMVCMNTMVTSSSMNIPTLEKCSHICVNLEK